MTDLVQRLRSYADDSSGGYERVMREAADHIEALETPRCNKTGNPIGTDTVMVDAPPCECQGCRNARRIEALEAALREMTDLVADRPYEADMRKALDIGRRALEGKP